MQFHPQFLIVSQFINMSSHEVPQPNEPVVDEKEPPAKTSKIVEEALKMIVEADNQMISAVMAVLKNFEYKGRQIQKNCVEEALKKIEEAAEEPPTKRSKIVEETLQKKDVEINLLRKQITDCYF